MPLNNNHSNQTLLEKLEELMRDEDFELLDQLPRWIF